MLSIGSKQFIFNGERARVSNDGDGDSTLHKKQGFV